VRLEAERFAIRLRTPFRIAHGTSTIREAILVHLFDDDGKTVGHGEGALPPYYPSTADACLRWLHEIPEPKEALVSGDAHAQQERADTAAARVALEIASHDLRACKAGTPLWRLWGLDAARIPPRWRTMSIPADEKELNAMLEEASASGSLRIKLKSGSGDLGWDEDCARLVSRRAVQLGLDANEGWTAEQAAKILTRLAASDIAFIEQPVRTEACHWIELRSRLKGIRVPPLLADESVQTEEDLVTFDGLADGINVKILKAGGLSAARRWITLARKLGMSVMVGTMVETGIGRTAAAQLAPLADWIDIDSAESIPAAPMVGFRMEGDRLLLSDRPGLGLQEV
jgi:L-Ala-D/L-Glu epimerase